MAVELTSIITVIQPVGADATNALTASSSILPLNDSPEIAARKKELLARRAKKQAPKTISKMLNRYYTEEAKKHHIFLKKETLIFGLKKK